MTTRLGAQPIMAPGWTGKERTDLALIDCDVHQIIRSQDDLMPYLSRVYREQVLDQGMLLPSSGYFNVNRRAGRTDLNTGCDGDANFEDHNIHTIGGEIEMLKEQHLDLWNVDYALLTGASTYAASLIPDPDYGAALCRAFNDWTLEEWAARDERFIVGISVSVQDPQRAVEEIERLAGHPKVKAIVLPTGARMPYGNRFYHPVWAACAEAGLAVVIHPGAEGAGMAGSPTGVGYPTYYIETRMARPQMAMAHAVSFIAEGVFELYPRLRVLFDECDQFWLVGMMWHMDADWKSLREQTPWVKRLPSEYVLDHIKVGSQPMLEPEDKTQFFMMLEAMHADRTLVYSSDWPHWDWDDPATTFPRLPEELHQRVFSDNARELFDL